MENTTAIKEIFDSLYLCEKQLTAGQMQFINSVQKQFRRDKTLSEKQLAALREIRKYIPVDQVRYSAQLKQCSGQLETLKRMNMKGLRPNRTSI